MNVLKIAVFLICIVFNIGALAEKLPGKHYLKQNDAGEYYVENNEGITMIEAAIIQLGYSSKWILACISHESIDTDPVRWVFIDIRNGGTFDSLNAENWKYFRDEAYPDLKNLELARYRDDTCP